MDYFENQSHNNAKDTTKKLSRKKIDLIRGLTILVAVILILLSFFVFPFEQTEERNVEIYKEKYSNDLSVDDKCYIDIKYAIPLTDIETKTYIGSGTSTIESPIDKPTVSTYYLVFDNDFDSAKAVVCVSSDASGTFEKRINGTNADPQRFYGTLIEKPHLFPDYGSAFTEQKQNIEDFDKLLEKYDYVVDIDLNANPFETVTVVVGLGLGTYTLILGIILILATIIVSKLFISEVPTKNVVEQSSLSENKQNKIGDDEWRCPNCQRINKNYVGSCGCGTNKP